MKVTILGCGGSGGVPLIGGKWGACDPDNPKNRRRRVSIFIEWNGARILVDTSPDFREQLLDAGINHIDAVLYTHAHADHLHGLDDLRGMNRLMQRPIDVYASAETLHQIEERFGYAFVPLQPGSSFYKPTLAPHVIDGPFAIGDAAPIVAFEQDHGFSTTLGFRFGRFAYSTDVVELDDRAFEILDGVDTWIVDCLRYEPHPTHSHLEKTLDWIERIGAKRAYLTHMDIGLDYNELSRRLPVHVEPAYDGLVIEV